MAKGSEGDAIRAARERAGMTQQQLADEVGVSRASVINWESGIEPRNSMSRIRDVLNMDDVLPAERRDDPRTMSNAELMSQVQLLIAEVNRRLLAGPGGHRQYTALDAIEEGELPEEARDDPRYRRPGDRKRPAN